MDQQDTGSPEFIEPTWDICLRIWWSYLWRVLVWGSCAGLLVGLIIGQFVKAAGGDGGRSGAVVALIVFVLMSVVAMRVILRIKYHRFRIVLLPRR